MYRPLIALAKAYQVAATARRVEGFTELLDAHGEALLGLELDITDRVKVEAAVAEAEARFGQVDEG